ncbi:MAG TPA: hypothetical protein VGF88_20780 [Acidobacteriaceae bacterium]
MSATVTEPTLQIELWISFVSLLRSYAAAANLNSAAPAHIEESENSVAIVAAESRLEMHFDSDTGKVRWHKRAASSSPIAGTFELLPQGSIAINGATKDLDHVAIDFIEIALKGHEFTRAEKGPQKGGALAPAAPTEEEKR